MFKIHEQCGGQFCNLLEGLGVHNVEFAPLTSNNQLYAKVREVFLKKIYKKFFKYFPQHKALIA